MEKTRNQKGRAAGSFVGRSMHAVLAAFVLASAISSAKTLAVGSSQNSQGLRFRIEPMLVTPSHGPMVFVVVENQGDCAQRGTLTLKTPDGWLVSPQEQVVDLPANKTERFGFNIQRAATTASSSYPLEVVFSEKEKPSISHKQNVVVTTAPYSSPTIDGKNDDWEAAVPVSSVTGEGDASRKTTASTFWSRRAFCVLVEVEEDQFEPARLGESIDSTNYGDAVQLAFGSEKPGLAKYEYLMVADGSEGKGNCYRLERDGRVLRWNIVEKAKCFVTRDGKMTRYECSIPFKVMRKTIRPSEGRAFCFSYLVHDPDGTGVRDWGEAVGLWPSQRSRDAWSAWWKPVGKEWCPFTSRIPWGMCSSKY